MVGDVVLAVIVRVDTNGLSELVVVFGLDNVVVRADNATGADFTRVAADVTVVALGTFGLVAATVLGFVIVLEIKNIFSFFLSNIACMLCKDKYIY